MVSTELLLKENKTRGNTLEHLIDNYKQWDKVEKKGMHWLRKRGNAIKHRGEEQEQEPAEVVEHLEKIYPLACSLYSKLGNKIDDNFSIYERCILKAKEPPWYALADSYSSAALRYAHIDEEIAVDVANKAYETAVRGFAGSWRIEGSDSLPVTELLDAMDQHDEEEAHSYYWDESIPPTHNQMKEIGEAGDRGFHPPYTIHELSSHFRDDRHESLTQRAHYYASEIREIVLSYLNRFPLLDLTDCLKSHWNSIVEEMEQVDPNVDVPRTSPEVWISPLDKLEVIIPVEDLDADFLMSGVRPSDFWKDQDLDHFKAVFERVCGELPEGLRY